VAQLSEWLQLMLAEIARKQDEARRAVAEQQLRTEQPSQPASQATPSG
jgi:hypothetical protein